jgi:hypothetical protein
MAITYPLALPTHKGMRALTVVPESFIAVTESPWTGDRQVQENQGARWIFEVTLPTMARADAAIFEAFFLKLKGQLGTFTMGDPANATPQGAGGGSPQVNGGSQTGNTLITDGWPISTTVLKANDNIQIGSGSTARLYRALDDVVSDGSGNATFDLWPAITAANTPADNAPLTINSPVGLFRLAENTVPFNANTATLYNYVFTAISEV